MRLPDTGRACFPRLRPSTVRAYPLDEATIAGPTSGTAYDLARGASMVPIATDGPPPVIEAPTPRARRFVDNVGNSLGEAAADVELRDALLEDSTIACLVRLNSRTAPPGTRLIWIYGGAIGSDLAADNVVRSLRFTAARELRVLWEHSAGTDVAGTFTGFTLEPFVWTLIHLRIRDVTGPGPGGTCAADLFVNGSPVSSQTGLVNSSDGGSGIWSVGATPDAGVSALQGDIDVAGVFVHAEALTNAEIEDDARRLRRSAFFTRHDLSVLTVDANDNTRDLTDLDGVDFVDNLDVTDQIDQATKTVRLSLLREQEQLTLAGLVTSSKLNLSDVEDPTSYVLSLLRESAVLEVRAARVPLGVIATADEFEMGVIFTGEIDEIDEGGEQIVVEARDSGGRLIDTHIEQEVDYSDPVTPFAVEGEMQFILNDNDDDGANNSVAGLTARTGSYQPITLFTPVSPSWSVLGWRQRREPVLPALRALAAQIGWECRYRYDPDPDQRRWRLTFYEPDRARIAADAVIDPDDVIDVRALRRSTFGRRTNVRVIYPSSETTLPTVPTPPAGYTATGGWYNVDGDGNRLTAWVSVQSDAAITATGKRQFMEVVEDSASQISTVNEAYDMAFGALRDLEEPGIAKSITLPSAWEADLNDMLRFRPTPGLFTAAQTLAVQQVTHSFGERSTTTVQLRGKPSVGFKRWLRLEARPGNGKPGVLDPSAALTAEPVGSMLQVFRNILDRSSYLTGGKFVQVRNPDFASFSAGLSNPPDGWSMAAGAWATDANVEVSSQLSGGKAIRLSTTTAQLRSDLVPISGDPYQALGLECSWTRAAGDDLVEINLRWYDATGTFISSRTIYPGGAVSAAIQTDNFQAVGAAVGVWFKSRAEGFAPPTNARFADLTVRGRQVGGGFNAVDVDDVSFYKVASKFKCGVLDVVAYPGWAGYAVPIAGAGGIALNVPLGDVAQQGGGFGIVDQHDVVANCPFKAVPTAAAGYMRVPFDGVWRLSAKVWMTPVAFAAGDFAAIDLVLNGTYVAGTGVRAALPGGGTILESFRFQPLLFLQAGGIACFRAQVETRLRTGDLITLDIRNFAAGAGSTLVWAYGNALDAGAVDITYLQGTLLIAE